MKSLGGVTLPDQSRWINKDTWYPVMQSARRTISGRSILWAKKLIAGIPIDIELRPDEAWLPYSDKETIISMAQEPGSIMVLIWDDLQYTVSFRHSDGAFAPEPVIGYATDADKDRFGGIIRLITI